MCVCRAHSYSDDCKARDLDVSGIGLETITALFLLVVFGAVAALLLLGGEGLAKLAATVGHPSNPVAKGLARMAEEAGPKGRRKAEQRVSDREREERAKELWRDIRKAYRIVYGVDIEEFEFDAKCAKYFSSTKSQAEES